ncbi:MAG: peptidoglycan DD-metalloendopeptidase family protein [Flavobacteriales bacterium]|nr:peptidoglycan DD-metalloendopeptidase family protein [Flavobacteriales bacterium]
MKMTAQISGWMTSLVVLLSFPMVLVSQHELSLTEAVFMDESANYPICLQFDENLFLCNWVTDQTFAYRNEKVIPNNNHVLELVKGEEKFCLPVHGKLWSIFKKGHHGLDINLQTGDTVRAAFNGKVRYAQYNKGGFGNLVIIRHYNGLETYYAHLSKLHVKANQPVKAGQVIGLGGSTGRSRGPHLHFEVRYKDKPLDPFAFIDYENRSLKSTELELSEVVFEPWKYSTQPTATANSTLSSLYTIARTNEPMGGEEISENSIISGIETLPKPAVTSSAVWHTIKKGDTLYALSLMYKTTVKKICTLNGLKDNCILQIGKKIRIK